MQGAKTVILNINIKVLRLKSHRQKCPGLKKPESIAKRPLEEITSESETLSNDQPPAKRPKLQQTSFSRDFPTFLYQGPGAA